MVPAAPIHPELLPILRAWRERCPKTPELGELVFPVCAKGRYRMGHKGDMLGIKDLLAAAEIAPAPADPFHACRHTLATHMTEATGNDHAVAMMLGHASKGSGAVTSGYTHTSVVYLYRELCKMTLQPAVEGVTSLQDKRRLRAAG